MPASKLNYVVVYKGVSQVYGSSTAKIALESPPPAGVPLEDKRVLYITYQPDTETLMVHPLPQEEVLSAEIKQPKRKASEQETQN